MVLASRRLGFGLATYGLGLGLEGNTLALRAALKKNFGITLKLK